MKHVMAAILLCCQPLALAAADVAATGSDYTHITLHHVGTMKGNYQAGQMLSRMENGVDMTFVAADPERNLHIQADTVDFLYSGDASGVPSGLRLTGQVTIRTGNNVIRSREANVDLEDGTALFTGDPQMDGEQIRDLRAKRIEVNLKTGDFEVKEGEIQQVVFGPADRSPDAGAADAESESE